MTIAQVALVGDPGLDGEETIACKSGYRVEPALHLSFDVDDADYLRTQDIPSHARLDLGGIWRPIESLERGVWRSEPLRRPAPGGSAPSDVTPDGNPARGRGQGHRAVLSRP